MGSLFSRPSNEVEEEGTPNQFRYPSKNGRYFGSHFIMGGERFEATQPEQYLFGENSDLNFLGSRPIPFPYPAPTSTEPTKTLKALINIRKESLKLVKIPINDGSREIPSSPKLQSSNVKYSVEFTFDSNCRCSITIMYFCTEDISGNGINYRPKDPKMSSETVHYKNGANQVFSQAENIITPSQFPESDWQYDVEREIYPIVIYCAALEGEEPKQSHVTTATIERHAEGLYVIKPLKQKLFIDGLAYLMQEIYGIENKNSFKKIDDDDSDENSSECVICMSDMRDTLILPCRHLCLCHSCADSLRYQASNCPICRSPFRALLQIRCVYRIPPAPLEFPTPTLNPDMPVVQMNAIPGYEMVPLLEALNGPYQPSELTAAAALSSLSQEAAARMNSLTGIVDEDTENTAIALEDFPPKVMVSSLSSKNREDSIPEEALTLSNSLGRRGKDAVIVVSEKEKPSRKRKLQLLHSSRNQEIKSPSDLEEDESHFVEQALPDLKEFSCSNSVIKYSSSFVNEEVEEDEEDEEEEKENDSHLASIECLPKNQLMIAAIDEFSDEEEDESIPEKASGQNPLGGELKILSESSQSTPVRQLDDQSKGNNYRYSKSIPSSLPTTPNCRLSNNASTRSSGDDSSFTSSSSTKQLLPSTTNSSSNNNHRSHHQSS